MIRYTAITGILAAALVLAGCGNSGSPAATDGDASQATAASRATGGQCDAYIAEIRNACLDNITRNLDLSCNNQLIAMAVIQDQAAGNLFDVGSDDANAKVVESICSQYLGSLRDKRKKKDAAMMPKGSAGPTCTALAAQFDTTCMAKLGQELLPDQCRNASVMMTALRSMPMEERCEAVHELLSQDQD